MPIIKLPEIDRIKAPIAQAVYGREDDDGSAVEFTIVVGRPEPLPEGHGDGWFCPVSVEGITHGVIPLIGVLAVDALSNAMVFVKRTLELRHAYPVRAL
jgi:hypothetical protein